MIGKILLDRSLDIRLGRFAFVNGTGAVCQCSSHTGTARITAAAAVISRQHRKQFFFPVVGFDMECLGCETEYESDKSISNALSIFNVPPVFCAVCSL